MRLALLSLVAGISLSLCSAPAFAQEKGGDDRTGPYDAVQGWPQPLPDKGYIWGSTGGIFAETPNKIFIANRGEIKLPDKLPRNFNGFSGSLGLAATGITPVFKNCIAIVDADGRQAKIVESATQIHDGQSSCPHGPCHAAIVDAGQNAVSFPPTKPGGRGRAKPLGFEIDRPIGLFAMIRRDTA